MDNVITYKVEVLHLAVCPDTDGAVACESHATLSTHASDRSVREEEFAFCVCVLRAVTRL